MVEGPYFNISHSGKQVIVGFSAESEIGVDVEFKNSIDVSKVSGYFHPEEINFLKNRDFSKEAFYKLWTRKESFLKAIGTGLYSDLSSVNVLQDEVDHQGIWDHNKNLWSKK